MAEPLMPLWGWGDPAHPRRLPEQALDHLTARFGRELPVSPPAPIEQFTLPAKTITPGGLEELKQSVDPRSVSDRLETRLVHSAGKSYPDLVRMRAGRPASLPDLVISPAAEDELAAVLAAASRTGTAVVPFGGGTSVTGGLSHPAGFNGSVTLDMARLAGLVSLDRESRIATFLAGTSGPALEQALAGTGLTLGHFPQSWKHATVGGFVATRSSGQSSTGYGRIDANVLGLRLVSPTGRIDLPAMPGTASGPGLRQLLVGSEGIFGAITSVDLQLAEAPEALLDSAWVVDGFAAGCELLRRLEIAGCEPTVARLSDEHETALTLELAASGRSGRVLRRWVGMRGGDGPCMLITCHEGQEGNAIAREAAAAAVLRAGGARRLGRAPARHWRRGRFDGPYMRDSLMDRGLLVDTLETATTWSALPELHRVIGSVLRDALSDTTDDPIVMCHVSHLYPGGASLYYTFVAPESASDPDAMIDRWWRVKRAAGDAIKSAGGTISHHHAIGTDHREWMPAEVGELGIRALAAVKAEFDPAGVMNPGKVLPDVTG